MTRCADVAPFVDGELGWFRAWLFRRHLRKCELCRIEVRWAMQLQAALERL